MESAGGNENLRIETRRLVLRRPLITDAGPVAELANNRAIAENLRRLPYPYSRADAEAWIARAGNATGGVGPRIVTLAASGAVVGVCGIQPSEHSDGLELGYWLGEPYWGHGFATEAAGAMIDAAFGDPAVTHLWCSCRVTNDASRRVIQKSGFLYQRLGTMPSLALGGEVPVEHYLMEREQWAGLLTSGEPRLHDARS